MGQDHGGAGVRRVRQRASVAEQEGVKNVLINSRVPGSVPSSFSYIISFDSYNSFVSN